MTYLGGIPMLGGRTMGGIQMLGGIPMLGGRTMGGRTMGGEEMGGEEMGGEEMGGIGIPYVERSAQSLAKTAIRLGHKHVDVFKKNGEPRAVSVLLKLLHGKKVAKKAPKRKTVAKKAPKRKTAAKKAPKRKATVKKHRKVPGSLI